MRAEQSRTVRLAARAAHASESELEQRLTRAATHLRVQTDLPGAFSCAEQLTATLLRGPGEISIHADDLAISQRARLEDLSRALRPERPVRFTSPPRSATRIAIGARPAEIAVTPDGHGARLTRSGTPRQQRAPSALGLMLAASFAAGEAFKDAAEVSEEHCIRHQDLAFCPVTLSEDLAAAPLAPAHWYPRVTLAGVGAIGTVHARLLSGLCDGGGAVLIDRQTYALENLGTYALGDRDDVTAATPKVKLAANALEGWRRYPHEGEIATALTAIDAHQLPWTPVTLAGLDNHDARADAQRLQSDRLLDAATGDTAVGLRDARPGGPCLRCMLPNASRPSPTKALTDLGIPLELAREPREAVVDEQLIAAATSEHARAILQAQRGTPICGLLRAAGLTALDSEDYMPSVPFVSQQAACLTIGRLLAIDTGIDAQLPNFFQYETLIGPQKATRQNRGADPACMCQQRAATIDAVRRERSQGPAA
jgi:molybdopterin/thiamine biosynthesis adenylyltransferase